MLKMNIEHISRHRHEKSSGSDNFGHKYELVEAEIALVIGDILTAQITTIAQFLELNKTNISLSIQNYKLYTEVRENESRLAQLNKAYERFVPHQFLHFLEKSTIIDVEMGDQVQLEMSENNTDISNWAMLSESMTAEDNFKFINSYLSGMEPVINENKGFIDKYIGDAIMALFSGEVEGFTYLAEKENAMGGNGFSD